MVCISYTKAMHVIYVMHVRLHRFERRNASTLVHSTIIVYFIFVYTCIVYSINGGATIGFTYINFQDPLVHYFKFVIVTQ